MRNDDNDSFCSTCDSDFDSDYPDPLRDSLDDFDHVERMLSFAIAVGIDLDADEMSDEMSAGS